MNSTRIISFTLCLGLACLLMMGNALAGKTEVAAEIKYAREVGGAGTQYVIPANTIVRTLSILPSASFFVKISLDGNAEFAEFTGAAGDGVLPDDADLTQTGGGSANTASVLGTPADGDTSVEYLVRVTSAFDDFPEFTFDTEGWGNQRSRQCARWRRNHQRHCHDASRQHRCNDRYRYRLRRVVERSWRCDRY